MAEFISDLETKKTRRAAVAEPAPPVVARPAAVDASDDPQLVAALTRAETAVTELQERLDADKLAAEVLERAAVDDPSDANIEAAIKAATALDLRGRALAKRREAAEEAQGAILAARQRVEHARTLAAFPLAFAAGFDRAAAPHIAKIVEAVEAIAAAVASLDELSRTSADQRSHASDAVHRHGFPSGSGGAAEPARVRDVVVAQVRGALVVARDFFQFAGLV